MMSLRGLLTSLPLMRAGMRNSLLITVSFLAAGCFFGSCCPHQRYAGTYSWSPRWPVFNHGFLDLKEDGTYRYEDTVFRNRRVSEGTWKPRLKGGVRLKSYMQSGRVLPMTVEEKRDDSRKFVLHTITNSFTDPRIKVYLKVGEDTIPFERDSAVFKGKLPERYNFSVLVTYPTFALDTSMSERISEVYFANGTGNNVFRISIPRYVNDDIGDYREMDVPVKISRKGAVQILWHRNFARHNRKAAWKRFVNKLSGRI